MQSTQIVLMSNHDKTEVPSTFIVSWMKLTGLPDDTIKKYATVTGFCIELATASGYHAAQIKEGNIAENIHG